MNNDRKHTPGPWEIDTSGGMGTRIVSRVPTAWNADTLDPRETVVVDLTGAMSGADLEADAALIAAAPDLLAALLDARATLDSIAGWNLAARPGHADHASRLDVVSRAARAEAAARASIAKAEGR